MSVLLTLMLSATEIFQYLQKIVFGPLNVEYVRSWINELLPFKFYSPVLLVF